METRRGARAIGLLRNQSTNYPSPVPCTHQYIYIYPDRDSHPPALRRGTRCCAPPTRSETRFARIIGRVYRSSFSLTETPSKAEHSTCIFLLNPVISRCSRAKWLYHNEGHAIVLYPVRRVTCNLHEDLLGRFFILIFLFFFNILNVQLCKQDKTKENQESFR